MSTEINTNIGMESQVPEVDSAGIRIDHQRNKIRAMVANVYGIQKLRIQSGNRLVASFKNLKDDSHKREQVLRMYLAGEIEVGEDGKIPAKYFGDEEETKQKKRGRKKKGSEVEASSETVETEQSENDKDEGAKDARFINSIMRDYRRITDEIADKSMRSSYTDNMINKAIEHARLTGELEFIGSVYDFRMAETYNALLQLEEQASKAIATEVYKHPMWNAFFKDVKGCGPMMAAICISYFDIHKARYPSAFWKYAGLDVVVLTDGTTEARGKKHVESSVYIDKDHKVQVKNGITYNPKLRSKLIAVLGSCILKLSRTKLEDGTSMPIGYAKIYYDYRNRLGNRTDIKNPTGPHLHNMAMRYMIKQFVRDLWIVWRKYEGYDIGEPYYEVAKLGMKPHHYNEAFDS